MQPRDRQVLIHLGYHGWLTHEQIQKLEFPSYQTLQRRVRELLLPKGWIDRKYLLDKYGNKTTIFRLSRKGGKFFKKDTGQKAHRPRFSQLKVPHRLAVNDVLVELKSTDMITINGFEMEKKLGSVRPDAYIKYDIPYCLEVDLSGGETKDFIQKKWRQYEREFMQGNLKCSYVVWYSSRSQRLFDWIEKNTNLESIYIDDQPEKILEVVDHIDSVSSRTITAIK